MYLRCFAVALPIASLLVLGCGKDDTDEGTSGADASGSAATEPSGGQTTSEGQTTSGGQTAPADTSGGDDSVDVSCNGAQAIPQLDGSPSGFEICDDGFIHRVGAPLCIVDDPPAMCESMSGNGSCTTSAECTDAPLGACVDDGIADPALAEGCHCEYACEADAECGEGQACACAVTGDRPRCIAAACTTDADCEGLCGMHEAPGPCGGSTFSLACLDPTSECRPGSCAEILDCNEEMMVSPPCVIASGQWACEPVECFTSCG